jgi:hypothetical protein
MTMLSSFSMVQHVCSTVLQHGSTTEPGRQWLCACGLRRANETNVKPILQHGPVPTTHDMVPSTPFGQAHNIDR